MSCVTTVRPRSPLGRNESSDSALTVARLTAPGSPARGLMRFFGDWSYRLVGLAHLLAPLGMTSTTLQPAAVPRGRLTKGYRLEGDQWVEEPPLPEVRRSGKTRDGYYGYIHVFFLVPLKVSKS